MPEAPSPPSRALSTTFGVDPAAGLSELEARLRLDRHGPNELPAPPRIAWPLRILRLLGEPMSLLLIAAAAVDAVGLGEVVDASAILAIVVLNTLIAFVQEGKAAQALEALRSLESPRARIMRDGVLVEIPSREVVPGDVVLLGAGDRVPADLRLTEANLLEVDESLLTGESLPVAKDPRAVPSASGIAERLDMAFSGTVTTRGTGRGVVVATGRASQIGRIAERLREREPTTPLQGELRVLTFRLGVIAIVIAAAVLGLTLVRMGVSSESLQRSFLAAVALAVAAVPEGLATVVTVALALGVRRMAARGAIIRRLAAVETLGAATVILTDKTGTLTENRMRVEGVAVAGMALGPPDGLAPALAEPVAEVVALCNDATLDPPGGDPLDVALLESLGSQMVARVRASLPRLRSIPFEAGRRRMTTVH
ncbi:MAG: HAD-IC family P-type ATPase, partial [Actinomycetota bacterium]